MKWHGNARATVRLDNPSFSGAADRLGLAGAPCWPRITSAGSAMDVRAKIVPPPSRAPPTTSVQQLPLASHNCHPGATSVTLEPQHITSVVEAECRSTAHGRSPAMSPHSASKSLSGVLSVMTGTTAGGVERNGTDGMTNTCPRIRKCLVLGQDWPYYHNNVCFAIWA